MQRTTQAQYSVKYSKKYTVSTQGYHLTFLNEMNTSLIIRKENISDKRSTNYVY